MEQVLSVRFLKGRSGDQIGKKVREMGFRGIDLPVESGFPCVPPRIASDLPALARELRDRHGIEITIASVAADSNDALAEPFYEACAEANVRFVSPAPFSIEGNSWWDGYENAGRRLAGLEKLSRRHGVITLIPIGSGRGLVTTGIAAWVMAKGFDPEFIRIRYNPAHLVLDGEDCAMGLGIVQHYLGVVDADNCRYAGAADTGRSRDGEPPWGTHHVRAPLDRGLVDWARLAKHLEDLDFDGPLCLMSGSGCSSSAESRVASDREYLEGLLSS